MAALSQRLLGTPAGTLNLDPEELLSRTLEADGRPIILLYDEADVYCTSNDAGTNVGRALFNSLEAARRDLAPRVALLAAGGLALFGLRESLGSNFVSRAAWIPMEPLRRSEMEALAAPLFVRDPVLGPTVIDGLSVMSGRNAALTTYGLQCLWNDQGNPPTIDAIVDAYSAFSDRYPGFARDFWKSLNDPSLSNVPLDVWRSIVRHTGPVPRESLLTAISGRNPIAMNLDDALRMLEAAGLIEVNGPRGADPLAVSPQQSILALQFLSERSGSAEFSVRLSADLVVLLEHIQSLGADYYRPSTGIVQESVFSATLTIGLRQLGWDVEREAIRAAGRTDLRIRSPGKDDTGIVEVKIWGRNDYQRIHEQVCSYWSADVSCGFAVTFSAAPPDRWLETYKAECLSATSIDTTRSPKPLVLAGQLAASSHLPEGRAVKIEHLLVRIPRRDH
ncbi:MAG: hypothetical protein IT370_36230 [Deltaproteobacteria bacterium]|nr:hypothetical protein [Deltaproteobacteria bacterium]